MKTGTISKSAMLATIAAVVFAAYTFLIYQGKGACFELPQANNSLGLMMVYGVDDILLFFKSRTPEQLACYAEFLRVWDVAFAVLYASMYGLWISGLFAKKRMLLVSAAILAAAFDGFENFLELQMMESFLADATVSSELVRLGSFANATKWAFSWLVFIIIAVGLWRKITMLYRGMNPEHAP